MKKLFFQFSKFATIGLINTALDFSIYTSLTRFFIFWNDHKVLTTSLAFFIANLNSYIFNKYWTFQDQGKKHHIQYTKFLTISLIGLGLTDLIFSLLLHLGLYDLLAKIIPIPFVLLWNFLANRYWTFRHRQKQENLV
jgi:putative flippase GtrA